MITLVAKADYNQKGQFIARLVGRDSRYTFSREFVGRKGGKRNETTRADVDDPGVYECCDVDRKKGKVSRFYFIVQDGDKLKELRADKEDAMTVAKALDAGRKFSEIVVLDGDLYEIRKPAQADRASGAIDKAVEECWAILSPLPSDVLAKAIKSLKDKSADGQGSTAD